MQTIQSHPPSPLWEKTRLPNQGLDKVQRKYLSKQRMVGRIKQGCVLLSKQIFVSSVSVVFSLSVSLVFSSDVYIGTTGVLSPTRNETSSEACQGHTRFQQHQDARCHQVSFPARQGAEGNSRHSDRNIDLFPSWSA